MQRRDFLVSSTVAAVAAGSAAQAAASQDAEYEEVLMPDLPIIDAHHHLFAFAALANRPARSYLLPDFLADIKAGGHRIVATVFAEDYTMYRTDGPVEMRSVGETEFANGIAAMAASGVYGPCRVNAGIVGLVDLTLGDRAKPVLEAHLAAAGPRFKSVRGSSAWDQYPVFGIDLPVARRDLLKNPDFRKGFAQLAPLGLAFDAFCFHTQLGDVADLADAFPQTTIVLDHLGTPLGVGPYAGKRAEVFEAWKASMKALSRRPNIVVKIGGMGMAMLGLPLADRKPRATSAALAAEWKPYVETCIAAFGVDRCMFESNYPPDNATATYRGLWNAFKRLSAGYSDAERAALFSGAANRAYRLGVDVPAHAA